MPAKSVWNGKSLTYTNAGAVAVPKGAVVVIGQVVGIALEDIPVGGAGAVAVSGVFEVPKVSGAVTQGAKLYLVVASGNFTTDAGTDPVNTFAGYAAEAAASDAATVKLLLHPPGA